MLRLMLDTIEEGSSSLELSCRPDEMELEFEGACFTSNVDIKLKIYRQIDKIYIKAIASVDAKMECSRCLDPISIKLDATSEVQYLPLPKFVGDQIDDIGIGYYSEEYIDISDEIRESLLLELPMTILCSEDCKGLCLHCGQNLNIRKCDCPESEISRDSKFAVLAKLLNIE